MRCKRCGTPLEPLDHLCKGCGKSIIALREDNEIIYDERELSQVEIDKLNRQEELSKKEVPKEEEISLDVFGDALFTTNQKDVPLNETPTNSNEKAVFAFEPENDKEEIIHANKLSESGHINDLVSEEEIIDIDTDPISDSKSINNATSNSNTAEEVLTEPEIIEPELNIPKLSTLEHDVPSDESNKSSINQAEVIPTEIKETKRKKKSKLPFILIMIALIILIIASVIFYFYTKTSPSKIFTSAIDKISINESIINNVREEISLNANIDGANDELLTELINNLKINMITHTSNNRFYLNINPIYKNNSLLDMDIYKSDSESYLYLKNIYDKYLSMEESEIFSGIQLPDTEISENRQRLVTELKKEIKKVLDSKFLSRSIEKINVNSKDEYVAKSIFKIDQSNYEELLNNIKSNQQLMTSLSSLLSLKEEETISVLEIAFKQIEKLEIILYSKLFDNEIIKYEFSIKTVANDPIKLEIEEENNTVHFILSDIKTNNKITGSLTTIKEGNTDQYTFVAKIDSCTITFHLSHSLEENAELYWPDMDGTVLFNELTEEEQQEIMEKIMSSDAMTEVSAILGYHFPDTTEPDKEENLDIDDENRRE